MEALILSLLTAFGILEIPEAALRRMDLQSLLKDLQNNNIEQVRRPEVSNGGSANKPDTTFDMHDCRYCKH